MQKLKAASAKQSQNTISISFANIEISKISALGVLEKCRRSYSGGILQYFKHRLKAASDKRNKYCATVFASNEMSKAIALRCIDKSYAFSKIVTLFMLRPYVLKIWFCLCYEESL